MQYPEKNTCGAAIPLKKFILIDFHVFSYFLPFSRDTFEIKWRLR